KVTNRLGDNERSNFVVECVGAHQVAPESLEARLVRNRIADTHLRRYLGTSGCANIDKQLVQNRVLLSLLGIHQVDRLLADHAEDRAMLGRVDVDPLADYDIRIVSTNRAEEDITLLGDMLDEEADLIAVTGEHDLGATLRVEDGVGVPEDIHLDIVAVSLHSV